MALKIQRLEPVRTEDLNVTMKTEGPMPTIEECTTDIIDRLGRTLDERLREEPADDEGEPEYFIRRYCEGVWLRDLCASSQFRPGLALLFHLIKTDLVGLDSAWELQPGPRTDTLKRVWATFDEAQRTALRASFNRAMDRLGAL